MLYLVTGGAGFIGSAVVRALLQRGERVRILDDFSTGTRANLDGLGPALEIVAGDILEHDTLARALAGVEAVFHLAAKVSVPRSLEEPEGDLRVNAAGTLAVFQAAAKTGVRRVVYSASAAAYGDNPNLPLRESELPAPLSPYGVSKLAGELYARLFPQAYGLETVALRYFNVYGPRQDPNSPYSGVLSRFFDALARGEAPVLLGDGAQTRDFVYVADVAEANLRALSAPAVAVSGQVFNVGTGRSVSLRELLEVLHTVTGRATAPRREPARGGDIRHSCADLTRTKAQLGFEPSWALREGLAQTWEWFCSEGQARRELDDARRSVTAQE